MADDALPIGPEWTTIKDPKDLPAGSPWKASAYNFSASSIVTRFSPIPQFEYPGCPGTTCCVGIADERGVFHLAHGPTEPCEWITSPVPIKSGDTLRIEMKGNETRWFVNDLEVTES